MATDVRHDLEFARSYLDTLPTLGGKLARAVGWNDAALAHPDEVQRVALALAELDASLLSLDQSLREASIAARMKQGDGR